ncbi:MAG TPA: MerR family transcriptional regulator [Jiangellaceae bacterium]|nr:MerR family transcriptional regulator [Jiangellaceae bacterium]
MTSALPARQTLSIGEVLAHLRPDFPDVTISKIRFLESEGLVEPQRSPSGYRRFSHDDIARLRFVLTVQRDHYLPLRVIKEQLEQLDGGTEPSVGGRPGTPYAVAGSTQEPGEVRLSRISLAEAAGISDELLTDLESYGLVTARGTSFDADALLIARTAGELAAYGLEPRHLRTIRSAAEREIGLVEQVVAPLLRQRGAEASGRGEEAAREIARLTSRLHAALVDARLRSVRTR